jgi:hypothetical protein
MTLKDLIITASKSADRIFRKDSCIHPLYHMLKPNGESAIWSAADLDDKETMVMAARAIMRELSIERYVFINEAWVLEAMNRTPEEVAEIDRFTSEFGVSEHPDRREVVMFFAENKAGEHLMAHRYILRPEHGKPSLSALKWFEPGELPIRGHMTGLLQ